MSRRRSLLPLAAFGALALFLGACSSPLPQTPTAPGDTDAVTPTLAPPSPPQPEQTPQTTPDGTTTPSPTAQPSSTPQTTSKPGKTTDPASKPGKTTDPASKPGKTSSPPSKPAPPSTSSGRWKPKAGITWQWQLSGKLDTSVKAQVYDVDLFDTSASQVAALHAAGRKVICYFSAGSYESGRPDSGSFPSAVKGKKMDGWPEYWLDIRDSRVLDIMADRMDLCAKKGFDGVEPDNVDAYQNDSGFSLSASDQLAYNKAIAKLAHDRGLAVGLKNDIDQVKALQSAFDFAVNEECFAWDECSVLKAFISAGKPVFHVEYDVSVSTFCPTTTALGFSSMRKNLDLDASRTPCP